MSWWKPKHQIVKTNLNVEAKVRGPDGKEHSIDAKSLRALLDQNPQIAEENPAAADLLEAMARGEHGNELSDEAAGLLEQRRE